MEEVRFGSVLAEGKTKIIWIDDADPERSVLLQSKDDITAGDGAMHDKIVGKEKLANRTACNVFRLLKACGLPVAFDQQVTPATFRAPKCSMFPYEVVIRRAGYGSYIDRNPHLQKGHHFPKLVLEYFLKTSGKKWGRYDLVKDDPLIRFRCVSEEAELYFPGFNAEERKTAKKGELVGQEPFLIIPACEVFRSSDFGRNVNLISRMGDIAKQAFLILEKAWHIQGRKLVDFKVEFGLDSDGNLMLADVIDNDSWRVLDEDGGYLDKQFYREGGDLNEVTAKYQMVAELTSRFSLPRQSLILWRGSVKDTMTGLSEWLNQLTPKPTLYMQSITCSVHKTPVLAFNQLQRCVSEVSDCVIIAYIGRSNGAGPILAANTTVPVITVPAGYRDFPEDIWSSLRTPSNVPVMTVLEPANAVLAALQILAMRNPQIYAALRFAQESRMPDL